jgi:hypothetical protein
MTALDPYWQAVVDELRRAPELETVGPAELKPFLPGLLSFREAREVPRRLLCHKGMVDRIPTDLLAACLGRARVAFANEVFVVFEITEASDPHVRALEVALSRQFLTTPEVGAGLLGRPRRRGGEGSARIVAALQSPTLLNIWASASTWKLEVAELGDHEALAERALLSAPQWDGNPDGVAAVLVTTPAQLERAEQFLPRAAKLWVFHRAMRGLLPDPLVTRVHGIVTLSRRVLDLQRTLQEELLAKPAWVVPPAYSAQASYGWRPDRAWLMKSRPSTRSATDLALLQ